MKKSMSKISKSFTAIFAVLLMINMVHTPCICGIVFSAESKHSCSAKPVVAETSKHSCCASKSTETEQPQAPVKNCSSDKCCSNWFYYIKTADFASLDRIDKAIGAIDLAPALVQTTSYTLDIAQAKAYWSVHPPDIVSHASFNPILRI